MKKKYEKPDFRILRFDEMKSEKKNEAKSQTEDKEMHVMGLVKDDKEIYITKCCFCENAKIETECECGIGKKGSDECEQFAVVENIDERLSELLANLPYNYGRDTFWDNIQTRH